MKLNEFKTNGLETIATWIKIEENKAVSQKHFQLFLYSYSLMLRSWVLVILQIQYVCFLDSVVGTLL